MTISYQIRTIVDLNIRRDAAIFDQPLAVQTIKREFGTRNVAAIDQRNFTADAANSAPSALSDKWSQFVKLEVVAEKSPSEAA